MKIYLIRHGETDYNKRRCFYGSHDVSLNAQGITQSQQLADVMASIQLDKIYTSQLKRTQETARLIFPHQSFQALSAFDEKAFGLWEGLTADEIEAAFPDSWQAWLEAPFEVTPPEAESFTIFQTRVHQGLEQLLRTETGKKIAIVAHLGVLRLIYQHLTQTEAVFWDIDFPQGTVTCLEQTTTHWNSYLLP